MISGPSVAVKRALIGFWIGGVPVAGRDLRGGVLWLVGKKRRVEVERKGQGQQTVAWVGGWFALGVTVEEVAGHYSARVGDQ